jgi:hypothetical protein
MVGTPDVSSGSYLSMVGLIPAMEVSIPHNAAEIELKCKTTGCRNQTVTFGIDTGGATTRWTSCN